MSESALSRHQLATNKSDKHLQMNYWIWPDRNRIGLLVVKNTLATKLEMRRMCFWNKKKLTLDAKKCWWRQLKMGKKGRHHRTITIEQDRVQMPTIDKNLRVRPSTQKHEDWVHSNSFCRLYMAYDVCPLISMQNNSKQITCIVATNIRR